ncbi:hypothetical protein HFP89_08960 [Wenzhouxiangella sp. XN79A]|uniref:hypothetical protein n=1 Tax=Wenzhouxiangella sp. XN79A TaxID=2724193 RepID=UPI00144A4D4F|nr:hypothetical protein [Wenzhouxiangella sp. XN79A]NKI35295.1 hypothetical protein [Wenzhouxiangella sp. XN79A]
MTRRTYDVAGFTLVLDKIVMVSGLFEAKNNEGWAFNVRLVSGARVAIKKPDRNEAVLERELLIKAIDAYDD